VKVFKVIAEATLKILSLFRRAVPTLQNQRSSDTGEVGLSKKQMRVQAFVTSRTSGSIEPSDKRIKKEVKLRTRLLFQLPDQRFEGK